MGSDIIVGGARSGWAVRRWFGTQTQCIYEKRDGAVLARLLGVAVVTGRHEPSLLHALGDCPDRLIILALGSVEIPRSLHPILKVKRAAGTEIISLALNRGFVAQVDTRLVPEGERLTIIHPGVVPEPHLSPAPTPDRLTPTDEPVEVPPRVSEGG